jgi:hypothetical protein
MAVMRKLIAVSVVAVCSIGHAEILQGITPLDTLGDVKRKYPNAAIARVKAAWVTESEAFYSLSGPGFPGTLYIAFSDSRPFFKQMSADAAAKAKTPDKSASDAATWNGLAQQNLLRRAGVR